MRIALLVEGKTELAFMPSLRGYLQTRLSKMPHIHPISQDGRIPKEDKLKKVVENLLSGKDAYNFVIALTDVYTGTEDFADALDAKTKMAQWTGNNPRFYPHAAQYDFEAWLLPYWPTIQQLAGHNKNAPHGNPETINHGKSPAKHIEEIFRIGGRREYVKRRDAARILDGKDLANAVAECPELKAFINTFLTLGGGVSIP